MHLKEVRVIKSHSTFCLRPLSISLNSTDLFAGGSCSAFDRNSSWGFQVPQTSCMWKGFDYILCFKHAFVV